MTINPNLLNDLQKTLEKYGYKLQHAVINTKQHNHRYLYDDKTIKILIEFNDKL